MLIIFHYLLTDADRVCGAVAQISTQNGHPAYGLRKKVRSQVDAKTQVKGAGVLRYTHVQAGQSFVSALFCVKKNSMDIRNSHKNKKISLT